MQLKCREQLGLRDCTSRFFLRKIRTSEMAAYTIPMPYTLESLLEEDSLGKLNQKLEAVHKEWGTKFKPYVHVSEAYHKMGSDNELREKVREAGGLDTDESIAKSAEILGISKEDLKAYLNLGGQCSEAMARVANVPQLKAEWTKLLETAPLRELTLDSFPKEFKKLFIVLYTTDWCLPCHVLKPTFARLSFFSDKAPLFFSLDDNLMEREEISSVPQLVAHFPNKGKVYSSCADTTREVWDTMQKLITLGKGFEGNGRLECSENECKIVSF